MPEASGPLCLRGAAHVRIVRSRKSQAGVCQHWSDCRAVRSFTGLKIHGSSSTGARGIKGLPTSVFLSCRYSSTCAPLGLHLPQAFISSPSSTACWLLS